jgi:hypothetical protein
MAMDSEQVIKQLHYRLTFLSALILRNTYDTSSFAEEYSSHLPHLELLVQSLISYQKHVYIKDILVRGQVDNSGEFDATYVVKRPQPEITSIYVEEFLQSISKFPASAATMKVVQKKLMFCYLFYRLASDSDVTVNPFTFTRLDEHYSAESYYYPLVKPLLRRLERRSVKKIMLMIAVIHRLRDGDGIKLVNRIKSRGQQITKVRSERHTSILVDGNAFSDVSFGEFEVWTLGSTTDGNGFAYGNIVWDLDTGSVVIGKSGLYLITWQCMYTNSLGHFGEHGWRVMLNDNTVELLSSSWNGSGGSSATISTARTAWLKEGDRLRVTVGPAKGRTSCYCAPAHTFLNVTMMPVQD